MSNLEVQAVSSINNFMYIMPVSLSCTVSLEMVLSVTFLCSIALILKGMDMKMKYKCSFMEAKSVNYWALPTLLTKRFVFLFRKSVANYMFVVLNTSAI